MYLLDTCVLSELTKKEPSKNVTQWLLERDERLFFVSALTFGKIKKGIQKVSDASKKKKLEIWCEEFLVPRFWDRILVVDGHLANIWGDLVAKAERKGQSVPTVDSLLAATAIMHHLHIVTRNIKDFKEFPLQVVNPWD